MYRTPTIRRVGAMADVTQQVGQPNGNDFFFANGVQFGGEGGYSSDICVVNGTQVDC